MDVEQAAHASARPVLLCTLNARHSHASLGLRYLLANSGALAERITMREYVAASPTEQLAQRMLAELPSGGRRVIAIGVYIWNVVAVTRLVGALRARTAHDPQLKIVVGGPEVSFEADRQPLCAMADHVIQGPGDLAFTRLVRALLDGPPPLQKIIAGDQPELDALSLPYALYTEEDLRTRSIYVEASRGCPFKCAFCLSALDRTAVPFRLGPFLDALRSMIERGGRRFKFVDRTFNLRTATSAAILDFFLDWIDTHPQDPCFVHFEMIPDHLPDALRERITRFPAGTLQFEIGIQSFDPQVQQNVDRRQDDAKAEANLRWLRDNTQAHLHVDLIAGLPGETFDSFARGYDRLHAIAPHEIQVGVLKRLRGAPLCAREDEHRLHFNAEAPYEILSSATMDEAQIDALKEFARFHDLVLNNGRMPGLVRLLMSEGSAFARMIDLAEHLGNTFGQRHGIALESLFEGVHGFLLTQHPDARERIDAVAIADYLACGAHGRPSFMQRGTSTRGQRHMRGPRSSNDDPTTPHGAPSSKHTPERQQRHLRDAAVQDTRSSAREA